MSRIDEIRERLAKATPGPWGWGRWGLMQLDPTNRKQNGELHSLGYVVSLPPAEYEQAPEANEADGDLIAHAPTDLAYLLERVEQLEGALRSVIEEWGESWDCSAYPGHQPMAAAIESARAALEDPDA